LKYLETDQGHLETRRNRLKSSWDSEKQTSTFSPYKFNDNNSFAKGNDDSDDNDNNSFAKGNDASDDNNVDDDSDDSHHIRML